MGCCEPVFISVVGLAGLAFAGAAYENRDRKSAIIAAVLIVVAVALAILTVLRAVFSL